MIFGLRRRQFFGRIINRLPNKNPEERELDPGVNTEVLREYWYTFGEEMKDIFFGFKALSGIHYKINEFSRSRPDKSKE